MWSNSPLDDSNAGSWLLLYWWIILCCLSCHEYTFLNHSTCNCLSCFINKLLHSGTPVQLMKMFNCTSLDSWASEIASPWSPDQRIELTDAALCCFPPGGSNVGLRYVDPPGRTLESVPRPELWAHVSGGNADDASPRQSAQSHTAQLWDGCDRRGWRWWPGGGCGRVSVRVMARQFLLIGSLQKFFGQNQAF